MTSCFPESHRRLEPLSIIHAMPEVVEAGASIYIMAGLIRDLPSMPCYARAFSKRELRVTFL
ncbi:MAG TPA: hypothetical protein VJ915_01335 [Balneolaceae bacterium]|nr:hypothetical protein [Balneolaceae bacterium]